MASADSAVRRSQLHPQSDRHGVRPQCGTPSAFKAVNTVLANIKTSIAATYRAGAKKHTPRRLAESAYRFNRRYDLSVMIIRLGWVAMRTQPMPYRLLKLAEDHG